MVSIKSKLRTLIILMVIIFIVFPLLSSVFDSLSVNMEPFAGYDTDVEFKMDRVETADGKHNYCPAGEIQCAVKTEFLVPFDDESKFNIGDGKEGTTYRSKCSTVVDWDKVDIPDGGGVICKNFLSENDMKEFEF